MQQSILQQRGSVIFPEYTGERVYMRGFYQREGLPKDLKRWQNTVDMMLVGIETDQPIYLMIDQSFVKAGQSQRRPGVHIDGYWVPHLSAHRGNDSDDGTHRGSQREDSGRHQGGGSGTHRGSDDRYCSNGWGGSDYSQPEGLILASTISASRAFVGTYDGVPMDKGDCAHIDLSDLTAVTLKSDLVYAGNVTMLHESLPVHVGCERTLVRLNVPGWTPHH